MKSNKPDSPSAWRPRKRTSAPRPAQWWGRCTPGRWPGSNDECDLEETTSSLFSSLFSLKAERLNESFATETHRSQCAATISPNCCTARSALHGSSTVTWTRLRWLRALLSACREIPELAASLIMAIFFSPSIKRWNNWKFSCEDGCRHPIFRSQ